MGHAVIDAGQFTPTARRLVAAFPASLATSLRADRNANDRRARELVRDCVGAGVGVAGGFPRRALGAVATFDATKISGCVFDVDPSDLGTRVLTFGSVANGSDFSNATWTKAGVTVIANDTTDPDGTTTADRITATSTGITSRILQNIVNGSIGNCIRGFILYAKRNDVDWLFIESRNSGTAVDRTWFNINTGVVGTTGTNHSGAAIVAVGGGWWRITLTVTASGNANFAIYLSSGDTIATGPTGAQYLWLWGAAVDETRIAGMINRASGVTWSQPAANNQPGITTMNGRTAIRAFSTSWILSTEAAVVAAFSGEDKPHTLILANKLQVVSSLAMFFSAGNSAQATDYEHYFGQTSTGGGRLSTVIADNATTSTGAAGNNLVLPDIVNPHVLEWYTNIAGQTIFFQIDGGAPSPNGANFNVGVVTTDRVVYLARARSVVSSPASGLVGRFSFLSRALSAAERSYVRVGLGNQWAIPVTP